MSQKEKKKLIIEYFSLIDKLKDEGIKEDQRVAISKRAKAIGSKYWLKEFRVVDTGHEEKTLQRLSSKATSNHGVKTKKELELDKLTDNDYVDVLCVDDEKCYNDIMSVHEELNHQKNCFKQVKEKFDCNYTTPVFRMVLKCCPTCAKKERSSKKAYDMIFSLVYYPYQTPMTVLVIEFVRKEYIFLRLLSMYSWSMIASNIISICNSVGYPETIRYIKSTNSTKSTKLQIESVEEIANQRAFNEEETEELMVQEMNSTLLNPVNTTPFSSQRNRNVFLLTKACEFVYDFIGQELNPKFSYNQNLTSIQLKLPCIEALINDNQPYHLQSRNQWLKATKKPLIDYLDKKILRDAPSGQC